MVLVTGPHAHAAAMTKSGLTCVDRHSKPLGNLKRDGFAVARNVDVARGKCSAIKAAEATSIFGGHKPDFVVVASKAWQLEDAAAVRKLLSGLVEENTPLLSVERKKTDGEGGRGRFKMALGQLKH